MVMEIKSVLCRLVRKIGDIGEGGEVYGIGVVSRGRKWPCKNDVSHPWAPRRENENSAI